MIPHVFLEAEPTLIYIQVLHSSFLLWCCFWKKKRCETDCFLSSSVEFAVCTPALEAVWAQLGMATGGGEERTRVHCHPRQAPPSRTVPLPGFLAPTFFTMVNKLHVKLCNWFYNAGLQRRDHPMGQVSHVQGVIGKTPSSQPFLSVGCCQVITQLQKALQYSLSHLCHSSHSRMLLPAPQTSPTRNTWQVKYTAGEQLQSCLQR